ncbi:MAG: malate dehydrogenase [Gammaproteobacteria bacterium]|nr:malate dehydrogenase [Gammaproteobacteria bacterium]
MSRKKMALVGGGQIGGILALQGTQRELGDIIIVDLPQKENWVKGKALDVMEMRPHEGYDVNLSGSGDCAAIEGSDVVVVTAGIPRNPDMSREDLLKANLETIANVAKFVKKYTPDAFVIVTTNPLDAMVHAFYKLSGLPKNRVLGMSGALDTARFRTFIAMETGMSVKDVSCVVLGGHGPTMVPLTRTACVGGIPIEELLSKDQIDAIVARTRQAGTEIVNLLVTGSAFYSTAASVMEIVEAYLKDKKRVLACSVLCEGQYGVDGLFVGVPCVIGSEGVERIVEFTLTASEQAAFNTTVEAVRSTVAETGL